MVSYKKKFNILKIKNYGLNPCCSGRWSSTDEMFNEFIRDWAVLILVVVDDGLVLNGAKFVHPNGLS